MKYKKESLVLAQLLKKIAPKIGASVLIEPKWGVVGQITFKSGARSYFRYNSLDLNPVGSSDIAKDKGFAYFFMQKMGYPIIPGSDAFYSERWAKAIDSNKNIDAAYRHAVKLGFPVIVKPNGGSQGVGVRLAHNKREFYEAMQEAFQSDRIALVQRPVYGKDYRIVVLDNKIISAYQRIPLNVIGDGKSTITKLLKAKQRKFATSNRDTQIDSSDPRIASKLKYQKMTFLSVPSKGQQVFLLNNANLSTGGDALDVTNTIHPDFKDIAINLTRDMGLRLCGVDIMVEGDISEKPKTYWIIEINAAPGLDHYVKIGGDQKRIVENLYLEVLKHLEH
jgi:D-alanine-D-alanine ligase-like ATP-grasp enzyme